MKLVAGLACLFVAPILLAAGGDAVRKELKSLEGTWKAVAMEAAGMEFPKDMVIDFTFVVGADGKSKGKSPQGEYQSRIVVDPAKNPKTIDHVYEDGPQKGAKQFGIYKIENGKWIACMTRPGANESDRPKTFATKDTANVLFTFERKK